MPAHRPTAARTVRRTLLGAFAGGAISVFCACPVSWGIAYALDAAASLPGGWDQMFATLAGGGLALSGLAIGAALGYLARDLQWEDLQ